MTFLLQFIYAALTTTVLRPVKLAGMKSLLRPRKAEATAPIRDQRAACDQQAAR